METYEEFTIWSCLRRLGADISAKKGEVQRQAMHMLQTMTIRSGGRRLGTRESKKKRNRIEKLSKYNTTSRPGYVCRGGRTTPKEKQTRHRKPMRALRKLETKSCWRRLAGNMLEANTTAVRRERFISLDAR